MICLKGGDMKNKQLGEILYHLTAIGITLVFILPLFWMAAASLRLPGLPPPRYFEWLPNPLSWGNYNLIFELIPLGRYIFNSLVVVIFAIPITLLVASLAGFGIAQIDPGKRRILLTLTVGILMTPVTALWLTRFIMVAWAGLVNTYAALILPALMGTSSLFVLLYYWTFRRIPIEITEAAIIDGADAPAIWWLIALPLARPTTMAVAILTFLYYWNDFINPLMYLKSQKMYTLAVGLQQLQQLDKTNWPILLAAAVVMTSPCCWYSSSSSAISWPKTDCQAL
jgi:multiple sugar transport system permease protein